MLVVQPSLCELYPIRDVAFNIFFFGNTLKIGVTAGATRCTINDQAPRQCMTESLKRRTVYSDARNGLGGT